MLNSQQKGKRFEREIAKRLSKSFDLDVKRTPQSGGMSFKGDIIALKGILSEFHWECKNQESLNIWKAFKQSKSDCRIGKIPTVVFTKNFEDQYIALRFDDFENILLELDELRKKSLT